MSENLPTLSIEKVITEFSSDLNPSTELKNERRAVICELERRILTLDGTYSMQEFNEGKIKHHYATGVYGRELFIPKGQVLISKIHRGKTFNIITEGKVSVISEMGFHTYEAPYIFVSDPFTKRVVISHEDSVWVTSHGTDKTDLDDIEDEIIAKDFSELKQLK